MHYILALIVVAGVVASTTKSVAETYTVSPTGSINSISKAIGLSKDGDTVEVEKGAYKGRIVVDKSIKLIGIDKPSIDGQGKGTVVLIKAPKCTFKGFLVIGSGESLTIEDAGIVLDSAPDSIIEDNKLEDVLFGIYLKNSRRSLIKNNVIIGKDLPLPQRGDGIRLWYSPETHILYNHTTQTRDLVMWWSGNTLIKGNKIEKGRYGLHYMYSNDNVFEDNLFIDNFVGGFLMYSSGIRFYHNIFARNQGLATGYGVGFKDLDDVVAEENLFIDNRIGLYLDNSPHLIDSWNKIEKNVIAFNDIGASFMPSIERNIIVSNSFIDNAEQIEVRGGGTLSGNKWFKENEGNFWSDYKGYDENNDGIGEIPYLAESLFESLVDRYPNLRIFIFSPVSQAIELASHAFPIFKPEPKVTDEYPMINSYIPEKFKGFKKKFSMGFLIISTLMVFIPLVLYFYLVKKTKGKVSD
ncbi:nitrous oxide reductase family maturation protein NosD [Desulfobacterota bacterium AH_259_B03_O07]|nr:nitrous oxide reductase family maturation protein NosD [Desulfobacterota bacterium AH_259_B03_O07]